MYEVLFDQKHSIFHKKKDSKEMTNVKQNIKAVNTILEGEVSQHSLSDLTMAYKALIGACAAYTKRTPFTPLGRERKKLVKTLQTRREAELNFLMNLSDARVAEYRESGYAWDYILREARSARITKLATFTDRTFRSMSGDDHPLTDVTGARRPEYLDRTFLDKLQLLSDDLIDMRLCHVLTEKERKHVKQRLHGLRKIWQDHPVLVGSIARRRR